MTRALVYVRQSQARKGETEDTSLSLDSQEAECRALCDRHGWIVVGVVRDHDLKGSDPTRPGMAEVMVRAKRREMDVVAVLAMSRFARDAPWQELAWRELRTHKVRVESVTEPNIDHTLLRGVLGVVNQYRAEEIGHHIAAAATERAHRGKTWGRVPLGYDRVNGVLTVNVAESAVVSGIYRDFVAGAPLRTVAARLIAEGVPTHSAGAWAPHTVAWILRNPVYRGDVRIGGRVVAQDAHEAIVSRDVWEAAQQRWTAPRVRDKPRCTSWAEGHVVHSCGARMHLTMSPRTEFSPTYPDGYPTFRCTNAVRVADRCLLPRRYLGRPLLEEAIRRCLVADLANALDPATAIKRARQASGSELVRRERAKLERERAAIQAQRREAESLVLTRRRDAAWLDERDREFAATESRIAARIAALPAVPDEAAIAAAWTEVKKMRAVVAGAPGPVLGPVWPQPVIRP